MRQQIIAYFPTKALHGPRMSIQETKSSKIRKADVKSPTICVPIRLALETLNRKGIEKNTTISIRYIISFYIIQYVIRYSLERSCYIEF